MKKIISLLVTALTVFCHPVWGQPVKLKQGSVVSGLKVSGVLNYKSTELNFDDLKSKFIILDFWNTACISCIKSFPKIDSLQKQYAGKIQFILANKESRDSTLRFFEKRKAIKMPGVPMITGAKELSDKFDIKAYPFTVWIDDSGIIKYFIAVYNISKENLDDFIAGKVVEAKKLDDSVFRGSYFDEGRPDSLKSKLQYYFYISRYSDAIDIGNSEVVETSDSLIRIASFRETIVGLYKKAFREYNKFKFNLPESVLLIVSDSSKYLMPQQADKRDAWFLNNGYSFDMVLPYTKKDVAYKIMQEHLYDYFGLKVRVLREFKNGKWLDILEIKE